MFKHINQINQMKHIKQMLCNHDFIPVNGTEVLVGKTLGYNLKPINEYEQVYKCRKCGIEIKQRYTYFMDYIPK